MSDKPKTFLEAMAVPAPPIVRMPDMGEGPDAGAAWHAAIRGPAQLTDTQEAARQWHARFAAGTAPVRVM